MLKPASLREHLAAAVPALKKNPDQLRLWVEDGRIVSTGAQGLGWEYHYTLTILVLDYTEHADALFLPLLAWVRRHQSEILENEEKRQKAIRFQADALSAKAVDLQIEVDLTERVVVRRVQSDPSQPVRHQVEHPAEPLHIASVAGPEHWEFFAGDQLLTAFDFEPLT